MTILNCNLIDSEAVTRGVLWKKVFLEISHKFTRKHLCQSLFFNKVAGLRPVTLLKKRLWHRCFPVYFAIFIRTPFYKTSLDDCFYWFPTSRINLLETLMIANDDSMIPIHINRNQLMISLREKCPNTEFFLVLTFLYSVRIQENTDQKNLRISKLFTQCLF